MLLQNVDARFMVCNGGALPERHGRTDSRLYHMNVSVIWRRHSLRRVLDYFIVARARVWHMERIYLSGVGSGQYLISAGNLKPDSQASECVRSEVRRVLCRVLCLGCLQGTFPLSALFCNKFWLPVTSFKSPRCLISFVGSTPSRDLVDCSAVVSNRLACRLVSLQFLSLCSPRPSFPLLLCTCFLVAILLVNRNVDRRQGLHFVPNAVLDCRVGVKKPLLFS